MCKGSSSKDNARLEFKRRKNLIEIAEDNPDAFKQIINNNLNLFHGTNSNALPGILKYGLLSENIMHENNNDILTGERWTRSKERSRSFISFTDQIDNALNYSGIAPSKDSKLLSFGIIIGISSDDIDDLHTFKVDSDFPELGIFDKLPLSKIKTIFVPEDKSEFVSKMIEGTQIQVTTLNSLMPEVEKKKYDYNNMEELMELRSTSGIKKMFNKVKRLIDNKLNKKENEGKDEDMVL